MNETDTRTWPAEVDAARWLRGATSAGDPLAPAIRAVLAEIKRLREDVAMYEQWAGDSPRYDAECPCGRQVSVRTVATEDVKRWQAMEKRARAKADAPRVLDGAASWVTAAHILGDAR